MPLCQFITTIIFLGKVGGLRWFHSIIGPQGFAVNNVATLDLSHSYEAKHTPEIFLLLHQPHTTQSSISDIHSVVACPTAAKVIRWWHVYWDPWHFFPETVKFCRPEGYKRKDGNPGGLARMTTTATATLAVTGKQGRRGTGMGFQTSSVSAALHLGGHSPLPV